MSKILLIGYLGFKTNQLDGQTVKTRNVLRLLQTKICQKILFFDTQEFAVSKLKLFDLIAKIIKSDTIIILPAHNSIRVLLPLSFIFSKLFNKKLIYIQVGGWLTEFIKNRKILQFILSSITIQLLETKAQIDAVQHDYNFENVDYFPNFRFFEPNTQTGNINNCFRIVFCARINKMKGLDTMDYLADYIDNNYKEGEVIIDFYGPIFEEDESYFKEIIVKHNCMAYKGELLPEQINSTLSTYDLLVLPTHYYKEGFPGTILDAYIAGIPVVATKWKHATEFIDDNKTGFIIPFDNCEMELCEKINFLFYNRHLIEEMKKHVLLKSQQFSVDNAWDVLNKYI